MDDEDGKQQWSASSERVSRRINIRVRARGYSRSSRHLVTSKNILMSSDAYLSRNFPDCSKMSITSYYTFISYSGTKLAKSMCIRSHAVGFTGRLLWKQ